MNTITIKIALAQNQTNLNLLIIYWQDKNIKAVLAFCRDTEFIIRIDELNCGKLRYLCWHKSKSIFNLPCLILRDGTIEKSASGDKLEFVFTNKDSLYVMEYLLPNTEDGRPQFFLEITDYRNKKSTWKMEEIPLPKYLLNL